MTGQFPYISGQGPVIRNAVASKMAGWELMSFRRLQQLNPELAAKVPRIRSLRDRWQSTMLRHGASQGTHC